MKVKKNSLVRLRYRICLRSGVEIDSAGPANPLQFVCGRGDVIAGLERELIGMEAGQTRSFAIRAEDAYGPRDDSLVQELPRAGLPADQQLEPGQRFSYRSERGAELTYRIQEVRPETIVADFNHPLAGETLLCDVEVLEVVEDGGEPRI